MRTTLTLEDDLARKLKDLAHQSRRSFKEVVNEIIRIGLEHRGKPVSKARIFQVEARHCGFVTGIDIGKLNQIADELEAADFVAKQRSR